MINPKKSQFNPKKSQYSHKTKTPIRTHKPLLAKRSNIRRKHYIDPQEGKGRSTHTPNPYGSNHPYKYVREYIKYSLTTYNYMKYIYV